MPSVLGQPDAASPAAGKSAINRYLAANVILWVFTYLLITARSFNMGTPLSMLLGMGARRVVVCSASFTFCLLIQHLLLRTRRWSLGRRLGLAAGLSILGGLFYVAVNQTAFFLIWPGAPFDGSTADFIYALMFNFSFLIWSFIAWCAIVFALSYDEEAREQSLRAVEAQALAAESQNQMLRYQINPHFLFNTLNALSSLILQKDVARAERMVLSLSNFLRASLEKAPGDRITLAEELDVQHQYLAIEQERFGDRLRLRETIPADLSTALLPGLILQPLIENAVKYGVARTAKPVTVEIIARTRGEQIAITVQDDAVPDRASLGARAPQTLGVGLENVRRRLEVLYGDAGRLTFGPRPGGGFAAEIELPLERRP